MTSLFCHILCASFLAATVVVGAKTGKHLDEIFAVVEKVYGLSERHLRNASVTGDQAWLASMIPKEKRKKIDDLKEGGANVLLFVKKLLSMALDVADKEKTAEQAFKIVKTDYDALSDDDIAVFERTFPDAVILFTGKGDSDKPMDEGEQKKNLKALQDLLESKKSKSTNPAILEQLNLYIQGFHDGKAWLSKDLEKAVGMFKDAVDAMDQSTFSLEEFNVLRNGLATFGELAVSKRSMSRMRLSMIQKQTEKELAKFQAAQEKYACFQKLLGEYAADFTA